MADSGKENRSKQKEQKWSQTPLKGTIRQQKVNRPNYLFASISSYIFKNDLHTYHTHTHTQILKNLLNTILSCQLSICFNY